MEYNRPEEVTANWKNNHHTAHVYASAQWYMPTLHALTHSDRVPYIGDDIVAAVAWHAERIHNPNDPSLGLDRELILDAQPWWFQQTRSGAVSPPQEVEAAQAAKKTRQQRLKSKSLDRLLKQPGEKSSRKKSSRDKQPPADCTFIDDTKGLPA